jgi:hypothetical protein
MNEINQKIIEDNLLYILSELEKQKNLADFYPKENLSYNEQMALIKEYLEIAGEFGLAYEMIVSTLENYPFILSSTSAIKLLEVGLLFGFKTENIKDKIYDLRK